VKRHSETLPGLASGPPDAISYGIADDEARMDDLVRHFGRIVRAAGESRRSFIASICAEHLLVEAHRFGAPIGEEDVVFDFHDVLLSD